MTKYTTVSIPRGLYEAIVKLNDETGYWPSISSFVREAAIDKLHKERERWKAVREEAGG